METETPVSYQRFKSKPTNRRLWPQSEKRDNWFGNWVNLNNTTTDPWDEIESPQFIDFCHVPEISDEFFETKEEPKPLLHSSKEQLLPRTNDHNTLLELLENFSLLKEKKNHIEKNIVNNKQHSEKQEQVVKVQCIKTEQKITDENKKNKLEKCHTIIKPFSFDSRDACKREKKEECIKKIIDENNKLKVFRAQPIPKFIKTTVPSVSGSTITYTKPEELNNKNLQEKSGTSTEIWKKSPFKPQPVKRVLPRPKTPPLLTAVRAEKRKRFEEKLKRKEEETEMLNSLIAIAKKKREKEEIRRYRKEIVHKAQPIRKYKSSLPQIEKPPLTEPLSPFHRKRRRFT